MKSHYEGKRFSCETCGTPFKTKPGLKRHKLKIHEKRADKKCSYCDRRYFDTHSLLVHERRHRGEKPYECDQVGCDYAFVVRSKLNKHLRERHGIDGRSEYAKRRDMLNQKLLQDEQESND